MSDKQDVLTKLKLEKYATKQFKSWYDQLLREMKKNKNLALTFEQTKKLEAVMLKVYKKIIKNMTPEQLRNSKDSVLKDIAERVEKESLEIAENKLNTQVGYIAGSTGREISTARNKATSAILEENESVTDEAVLAIALTLLRRRFKSKSKAAGITETNWLAELTRREVATISTEVSAKLSKDIAEKLIIESNDLVSIAKLKETKEEINLTKISKIDKRKNSEKFIKKINSLAEDGREQIAVMREATDINVIVRAKEKVEKKAMDILNVVSAYAVMFKTWVNMGDKRVRPTHVQAGYSAKRRINKPFNVGMYLMQYPGDTSLGAGIEEIAECRCFVSYI